ncbi:somatostatin receptor type 4-like [Stylophora pistillata]|uniref:somatostatin receptor type 4-like n=1 Tax=Stylophora pistillata TaxID=50429 RepID=UPI000C04CDD7|nr:somatostatin receptor type 4-like [Stylophora pistillata]
MSKAVALVFTAIYAVQATIIIIGNTFTIFVFWTQRFRLKRFCYLLINLAVCDLLVGITEPIILGVSKFQGMTAAGRRKGGNIKNLWSLLFTSTQVLAFTTSVFFLAIISLERVYAVLWPLRHRVEKTSLYISSIILVWAGGLCLSRMSLMEMYHPDVERRSVVVATHISLFIALMITCASYFTICSRLRSKKTASGLMVQRNQQSSLRHSRTFFVVVAVSLVFWLPAFAVYIAKEFCLCFPAPVVWFASALRLANSMVNPFVYSLRMPIFKDALTKLWRRHQGKIELRSIRINITAKSRV